MDFYKYLFDIDALDNVIAGHNQKIEEDKKRIEFIRQQADTRKNELSDKSDQLQVVIKELSDKEARLFKYDQQLQKSHDNMTQVTSASQESALQNEIETITQERESLEERMLSLLEEQEDLEQACKESKDFITGVEETISEELEAHQKLCVEHQEEIKKLEHQISGLMEEVPDSFKGIFSNVRDKFRFKQPLAILKGDSCSICRFQVAASDQSEIKNGTHYTCASCGRLIFDKQYS